MALYPLLLSLQSSSDIADNQDRLLKGKLHGENFPVSSSKSARLGWGRGDSQVNMVFVEGLQRIQVAAINHVVSALEMERWPNLTADLGKFVFM